LDTDDWDDAAYDVGAFGGSGAYVGGVGGVYGFDFKTGWFNPRLHADESLLYNVKTWLATKPTYVSSALSAAGAAAGIVTTAHGASSSSSSQGLSAAASSAATGFEATTSLLSNWPYWVSVDGNNLEATGELQGDGYTVYNPDGSVSIIQMAGDATDQGG
jgi:hypothetical protein